MPAYTNLVMAATGTGPTQSVYCNSADGHMITVTSTLVMTALVVNMEGSIDNENFGDFATLTFTGPQLTAKVASKTVTLAPYQYFRCNITTFTAAAGSPTVNIRYSHIGM